MEKEKNITNAPKYVYHSKVKVFSKTQLKPCCHIFLHIMTICIDSVRYQDYYSAHCCKIVVRSSKYSW